jgi:hypothetical protein
MEPIERELMERKERRKKLAIELQALEAAPSLRKAAERSERQARLAALRRTLNVLVWSIGDLEEIIAEGPTPQRLPRPSVEGRRRLSQQERKAIERRTRANIKARLGGSDAGVIIHVASVTGPNGLPEVHIELGPEGDL